MKRITFQELECLVAVADHLNFSKAATQLHLSQPPLTRHIQALEDKLGTGLFKRNTHSVALTSAGRLFLEDARAMLRHLDRAVDAVGRMSQGETARLRFAFIGALLDEKLVGLIQRFRKIYPECQIQIADLAPSVQLAAIKAGELDGGFIGAKPFRLAREIDCIVWAAEPLLLVLPEKHPLAASRGLRWHQFKNLGWIMVSRQAAPAFREQFSELEKTHGFSARIVQESDRVPAILTMVAAGSGVTVVPASVKHLISKGVVFRKLPEPQPSLLHTFVYRREGMSAALAHFIELLKIQANVSLRKV